LELLILYSRCCKGVGKYMQAICKLQASNMMYKCIMYTIPVAVLYGMSSDLMAYARWSEAISSLV
jgi:hypothetical protein